MTYEVHFTDKERDIFFGITYGTETGGWIKANDQSRMVGKEFVRIMRKRSKNSKAAMARTKRWLKLIDATAEKHNLTITTWGTY